MARRRRTGVFTGGVEETEEELRRRPVPPKPRRRRRGRTPKPEILEMGVPVLGLCYGLQLLASMHGGKVEKAREYGVTQAIVDKPFGVLE